MWLLAELLAQPARICSGEWFLTVYAVLLTVGLNSGENLCVKLGAGGTKKRQKVIKAHNRVHIKAKFLLDSLNSAQVTLLSTLLAVKSDNHTTDLGILHRKDVNAFANGRTSSDDIIHNEHTLTTNRSTDKKTSLAMVLLLLAVVCNGNILSKLAVQRGGNNTCKRDTLVCRSEEDVKFNSRAHNSLRVEVSKTIESRAGVEETRVEEVRALASRLEREFSELEHLALQSKLKELLLVRRKHVALSGLLDLGTLRLRLFSTRPNAVDHVAELLGSSLGVLRTRNSTGHRHKKSHSILSKSSLGGSFEVSSLEANSRGQNPQRGCGSPRASKCLNIRCAYHKSNIVVIIPLLTQLRHTFVKKTAFRERHSLEILRTRVRGLAENKSTSRGVFAYKRHD
mmetsp:Transcript_1662/g.3901  ORF Transcript_1662/g.3901 Transcript_1662/m.3901 type:complete len:397 (-) Transcript_1662:606-1796(-)